VFEQSTAWSPALLQPPFDLTASMPVGKHLENEMASEVVHGLYHAIRAAESIDYERLATYYGSKNKNAAQVLHWRG
jgi:hypothetical protein